MTPASNPDPDHRPGTVPHRDPRCQHTVPPAAGRGGDQEGRCRHRVPNATRPAENPYAGTVCLTARPSPGRDLPGGDTGHATPGCRVRRSGS